MMEKQLPGLAFIYVRKKILVHNYQHVIFYYYKQTCCRKWNKFTFQSKNRENSTQENIDMLNIQSFIVQHPERNVDLCAINISQIFQILTDNNKT